MPTPVLMAFGSTLQTRPRHTFAQATFFKKGLLHLPNLLI